MTDEINNRIIKQMEHALSWTNISIDRIKNCAKYLQHKEDCNTTDKLDGHLKQCNCGVTHEYSSAINDMTSIAHHMKEIIKEKTSEGK